jgi:hypothetical protein
MFVRTPRRSGQAQREPESRLDSRVRGNDGPRPQSRQATFAIRANSFLDAASERSRWTKTLLIVRRYLGRTYRFPSCKTPIFPRLQCSSESGALQFPRDTVA